MNARTGTLFGGTGTVNLDVSYSFFVEFDHRIDDVHGGDPQRALAELYRIARRHWSTKRTRSRKGGV